MIKNKRVFAIGLLLFLLTCLFAVSVFGARIETSAISKLDVFDADIRTVFRSLGELGNISVLMDPEVKGNITVNFKEGVNVAEAIEFLAETYGYSYHWLPNNRLVIIGSQKTFENFQSRETRVYHFSYAKVDQVVEALRNIVPPEKLGVDLRTNQITITASVLQHQNVEEVIKHLDREMPQIIIEIRVEEISKEAKEYLGVPWSKGDVTLNFTQPALAIPTNKSLDFLETKSLARLLTNPKIATTDGQDGSIFIGEKQPYETTSTQNGVTTYTINWIDVGTTLTVNPRINQDDIVTVNVRAVVSNITEKIKIGGNDIPVTRNREISSVIRLRDGETFALSGLSEIQQGESETGLKGFSKIPIIGWLFKSKTTDPSSSKEVCIFITPKIVKVNPSDKNQNNGVIINNNQSINNISTEQKSNTANTTKVSNATDPKNTVTGGIAESSEQKSNTDTTVSNQTPNKKSDDQKSKSETIVTVPTSETTDASSNTANSQEKVENNTVNQSEETVTDIETVADDETVSDDSDTLITNDDKTENLEGTANDASDQPATTRQESVIQKIQYRIVSGDSIPSIAKTFGLKADDIAGANNLKLNSKLKIGDSITVPVPSSRIYQLKPKETLWRLSKRYGTTVDILMKINHITDITKVKAGQDIILPVDVDQIFNNAY